MHHNVGLESRPNPGLFQCHHTVTGRSGDRIPVRPRFSAPVHTGPGAHPASCTVGTGSKSAEGGVNRSPISSADFKERVKLYVHSHYGRSWKVMVWTSPYRYSWLVIHGACVSVNWHVKSTANLRNTEPFRQAAQHSTGVSCSGYFKVRYAIGWPLSWNNCKQPASKIISRVIWTRHAKCSPPGTKICNFRGWQPWMPWRRGFKRHEYLEKNNNARTYPVFTLTAHEARRLSSFFVCIVTSGFCSQRHKRLRRNVKFCLWKVS